MQDRQYPLFTESAEAKRRHYLNRPHTWEDIRNWPEAMQKEYLQFLLSTYEASKADLCRMLGVSKSTFYRHTKDWGLRSNPKTRSLPLIALRWLDFLEQADDEEHWTEDDWLEDEDDDDNDDDWPDIEDILTYDVTVLVKGLELTKGEALDLANDILRQLPDGVPENLLVRVDRRLP